MISDEYDTGAENKEVIKIYQDLIELGYQDIASATDAIDNRKMPLELMQRILMETGRGIDPRLVLTVIRSHARAKKERDNKNLK